MVEEMAAENVKRNYSSARAEAYTAPPQRRKNAARPAWQPYEQPKHEERRKTPAPKPKYDGDYHPVTPLKILTPDEIRAICIVVIIVTAIAMGIIFLSAQAAVKQKEINDLQKGITQVDDDIANLKIQIEQSQNMQLIKDRAQNELGMQEPTFDQYVYVDDLPAVQSDFGTYIKERAYGGTGSQPTDQATQ